MKKKTIFLLGADTGGHVVPVFAIASELEKDPAIEVFVIGVGSEVEKKFYSKLKHSKYLKIRAGKAQFGSVSKVSAFFKSGIGLAQSKYLILKHRPNVIFLKGNYATLPMAFAARILGRPVMVHESDAVLGRSNRIISTFAKKVFLSYPENVYGPAIKNSEYCGPILRPEFQKITSKRPEDYQIFSFDPKLPTILVLGGSLGAKTINKNVIGALEKILANCQIIHQIGRADFSDATKAKKALSRELQKNYFISEFIEDELFAAIRISDLVVTRAGSGIFELAACEKATILVPYPHAAADHQFQNAKYFIEKTAAEVIEDKNLSPTILYSAISKLLGNENKRKALAENLKKSVKLDGRDIVIKYIKQFL